MCRRGLTLIELLVIIAIVCVLAALIIPASIQINNAMNPKYSKPFVLSEIKVLENSNATILVAEDGATYPLQGAAWFVPPVGSTIRITYVNLEAKYIEIYNHNSGEFEKYNPIAVKKK